MNTRFAKLFRHLFLLFLPLFLLAFTQSSIAQDGEKLFKSYCGACHSLTDKIIIGPGLGGVMNRVPSEEWMIKWIKNSGEMVKSGDKYAVDIYNKFNKSPMTPFGFLKDEEIKAIIEFVKNPPVPPPPPVSVSSPPPGGECVDCEKDSNLVWWLLAAVIFLLTFIWVFAGIRRNLKNAYNQRVGIPVEPARGFMEESWVWLSRHKHFVAICLIVLFSIGSKAAWDWMMGLGIYANPETGQVYKPTQPIRFSHKIHAGDNKINCVYCHNGAEKSKTAGIPTVNVCMNCHKGIDKGPTGTAEIAKIYEAAGWDPATSQYSKPQKPIKWVKVHNLPDFVYFNHSQHIVAGKQECATCHGDLTTMDVAQQVNLLTMRWCVDCHRTTEVAMAGNPYYEELHKKLAEKYKNKKITVEQMGGLECGKCHY